MGGRYNHIKSLCFQQPNRPPPPGLPGPLGTAIVRLPPDDHQHEPINPPQLWRVFSVKGKEVTSMWILLGYIICAIAKTAGYSRLYTASRHSFRSGCPGLFWQYWRSLS